MFDKVILNKYGYYVLKDIPTKQELAQYYAEKYYQESKGSYQKIYSDAEKKYILNKISQKYFIINDILRPDNCSEFSLLDIGCGEGWALKYFKDQNWSIHGIDYSLFGCKIHNPECCQYIIEGDMDVNIDHLLNNKQKGFDLIWLDNVLEHILDPFDLLNKCHALVKNTGLLVIEVPNDFSRVQQFLYMNAYISKPFWVVNPDHISYFNKEGLISLCDDAGWECEYFMGDFPIDFMLFNKETNYIEDKSMGKSCHQTRVAVENFLHDISPKLTNELYQALATLGLGRSIIGFFKLKGEKL